MNKKFGEGIVLFQIDRAFKLCQLWNGIKWIRKIELNWIEWG